MKTPNPYYLIGIGLSAGGLEPLLALFDHLPGDLDAAFLIASHLFPGNKSELADILQKHTLMPVAWATDRQLVRRDHIYILAESKMLSVEAGALHVRERKQGEVVNRAIDILLTSMAADLGTRAISIILSSMDGDGTMGSIAVHRGGGITFAQETASATYASMPKNAILSGQIMFVLSICDMADMLIEITKIVIPIPVVN